MLVGTTTYPTNIVSGSNYSALGSSVSEGSSTSGISVSTTPVNITRTSSLGGLAFITGFNGGNQGVWLVMWNNGGVPAVISSNNGTGLTVAFTTSTGALLMNTTSGTVVVSVQAFTAA
jgi:hypothetical protein